jgi:hypothetical protein
MVSISQFLAPPTFARSEQDEATLALVNAQTAVVSAYQIVLQAEQAGGNVTYLSAQLNDAGRLLTEAHVAFRTENFSEAVYFANACYNISENVIKSAEEQRSINDLASTPIVIQGESFRLIQKLCLLHDVEMRR